MIDVIIIGAGTAGLSAAIYVQRAGKKALVLEESTYVVDQGVVVVQVAKDTGVVITVGCFDMEVSNIECGEVGSPDTSDDAGIIAEVSLYR